MSVEISLLVVTEFDAVSARFASMADLVTRANATSHAFFVRPARVVTCLPSTTIRALRVHLRVRFCEIYLPAVFLCAFVCLLAFSHRRVCRENMCGGCILYISSESSVPVFFCTNWPNTRARAAFVLMLPWQLRRRSNIQEP